MHTYTTITDGINWINAVQRIKGVHSNDGERLMAGHLGIVVQHARLRASIHRVDPENTAIRRSIAIRRRGYHVNGPNSLWYLDGHHKLIWWKFVTHAAVDGYSRTITHLKCADNCAATVLFKCIYVHGLPERIRSDFGGESWWNNIVQQQLLLAAPHIMSASGVMCICVFQ